MVSRWKFESYIPAVQEQLSKFVEEMGEDIPDASVSPRLHKHISDVTEKRYGRCELGEGWIMVEAENNTFKWVAREPDDCKEDLKELARNMKVELNRRFSSSFPKLNSMLHKCLDFGLLFSGLCGVRKDDIQPVNKGAYSALGATEFKKCVEFVSKLPHVHEKTWNSPQCFQGGSKLTVCGITGVSGIRIGSLLAIEININECGLGNTVLFTFP